MHSKSASCKNSCLSGLGFHPESGFLSRHRSRNSIHACSATGPALKSQPRRAAHVPTRSTATRVRWWRVAFRTLFNRSAVHNDARRLSRLVQPRSAARHGILVCLISTVQHGWNFRNGLKKKIRFVIYVMSLLLLFTVSSWDQL